MKIRSLILLIVFACTFWFVAYSFQTATKVKLPTNDDPTLLYSSETKQDLRQTYLSAIKEAKKSITLVIFTLRDRSIIHALNEKAKEGVAVYVVYDARAAKNLDSQLASSVKRMKRDPEGITHQKILIVDDQLVLLGTTNLTTGSLRYYTNLVGGFWSPDMARWLKERISQLGPFNEGPGGHRTFSQDGQQIELWFLPTGASGPDEMIKLIRSAKKTLKIAMFTWTRLDFSREVIEAFKRGVDVQVVIDKQSGYGASIHVIEALKEAGVPIYFQKGDQMMHTKTMIVDDQILVNGSANWTLSAFTRNDDCFVIISPLSTGQKNFLNIFWKNLIRDSYKSE